MRSNAIKCDWVQPLSLVDNSAAREGSICFGDGRRRCSAICLTTFPVYCLERCRDGDRRVWLCPAESTGAGPALWNGVAGLLADSSVATSGGQRARQSTSAALAEARTDCPLRKAEQEAHVDEGGPNILLRPGAGRAQPPRPLRSASADTTRIGGTGLMHLDAGSKWPGIAIATLPCRSRLPRRVPTRAGQNRQASALPPFAEICPILLDSYLAVQNSNGHAALEYPASV